MKARFVYFDLEHSGTVDEEIIQIGARGSRNDDSDFSVFAYPNGEISDYVTNYIHGISKVNFDSLSKCFSTFSKSRNLWNCRIVSET